MKTLNRLLVVLTIAIGITIGRLYHQSGNDAMATSIVPVYLEKPSIPTILGTPKSEINIDLNSQEAKITGNAKEVSVNVTTPVKVRYKYKTIKEIEYVPVFRFAPKDLVPVKPELIGVCMPGHIDKI